MGPEADKCIRWNSGGLIGYFEDWPNRWSAIGNGLNAVVFQETLVAKTAESASMELSIMLDS